MQGSAELTYTYEDAKVFFFGDPLARSDDRSLLGARIGIGTSDEAWELSVFARNLTNSDAVTFAYTNVAFGRTYALEDPARIGIELRARR